VGHSRQTTGALDHVIGGQPGAAAIDPDRAEALAREIPDPNQQVSTLAHVAMVLASTDPDRANQLINHAETLARKIQHPNQQVHALIDVARAVAHLDPARADRLIDDAESLIHEIPDSRGKSSVLAHLSVAMIFRHPDRADALVHSISDPWPRAETLTRMAVAVAGTDPDRAETLALEIAIPDQRARALAGVAEAVVKTAHSAMANGSTRPGSGSPTITSAISIAEPVGRRPEHLLAHAWSAAAWTSPLSALAVVDTSVLHALAADMLGEEQ
jgi:F0F1-type ATP synthase epsilon subunit